jgi:hypothetical protein
MFDTLPKTSETKNEEDVIFPELGDEIILPGTSSAAGSSTNSNRLGPRATSNPFSNIGIDLAESVDDSLGIINDGPVSIEINRDSSDFEDD